VKIPLAVYCSISNKYDQLIEATALAVRLGHGRYALNRHNCELCQSLFTLRQRVERSERIVLGIIINDRLKTP
tara:strand:- start:4483 stop:4701 length:219 start_codon:yes stop_codon:yes gene_type:complete